MNLRSFNKSERLPDSTFNQNLISTQTLFRIELQRTSEIVALTNLENTTWRIIREENICSR